MAGETVRSNLEMTYSNTKRYKGEVFRLIGARNDDALIRVGHVSLYATDLPRQRDDMSGREFVDEMALRAYQITAPRDAVIIRRGPGRPKGSANKRPQAKTTPIKIQEPAPE